ncbi:MAG: hypothetical protein AABP62_29610 [Planctomycetota bacterium]
MRRVVLIGAIVLTGMSLGAWVGPSRGGEIGFIEEFSLAPDRTVPLKQLIPGTDDYYYYHCLHFLNTEQFEKARELTGPWHQRHGQTGRLTEIQTRHALLTYDKNPQVSLDYLRNKLGLNFGHERELLGVEPNLPTALDQKVISREEYINRANAITQDNTDGFEDTALDWLVGYELNPNHRRHLLSRLQRPDYATLVKLIVADLNHPNSGGFGSLPIHHNLLLSQLDELLKLKPELLTQQNFVLAYLRRLQPGADDDWRHDRAVLAAYLDRLLAFADRVVPSHNSLKGHVLYHRLVLDRVQGKMDKDRFLAYLKLPRPVGYLSKRMAESDDLKRFAVDLNSNYGGATLLNPIGNDEPLVRAYLSHFLLDAANTKDFEPYINDVYLKHLFAEVKIVNGLGEPEQWAALLPPELFQQLKERIDIDFVSTNKTQFAADEPVKLDLHVKNVGTLIVKVFEINTKNYYRDALREVDTDINLDGLVANVEQTHSYNETPLRRVARKFEFPQLSKPGVYIVDFIGNGRSSRALIRKGRLRHLVRTTPTGQIFTVLDDNGKPVKDASVWLAGHEYTPNIIALNKFSDEPQPTEKTGEILVPFSTNPGRQPIVISRGELSSLDHFNHEAENYALAVGIYVDREALLKRKTASVIVRPGLTLNGTPVSLNLLEEVKLTINSVDLDGTATSQEIPNFKLFEDRESIHDFQVPARLASISFMLTAKVKKLSAGGQKIDLAGGDSFELNGIDRTEKVELLHLMRTAAGYVVELRGRTGESKISRPVQFAFKHRDFRHLHHVTLKTDPAGRINLGALTDIQTVSAINPENTQHTWHLRGDEHTYSQTLHGRVGEPIRLPFLPRSVAPAITRSDVSLLELRGNLFVVDRFGHLSVKDGMLVIDKLPAGDYELLLKSTGSYIRLRVTEGDKLGRFVAGKRRQLETPALAPLQIADISVGDGKVTIRLTNSTKFARVHVFGTRYLPEYSAYSNLSRVRAAEPYLFQQSPAESVYLTGRNIGDEYRYIIDRKYATKFPGNMLDRPSLLLNPWAVRTTETGEQVAAGGDAFNAVGAPQASMGKRDEARAESASAADAHLANLDFLAHASAVLVNLAPDKDGVVTFDRKALGDHQHLHVVAVDPVSTTYRSASLPEAMTDFLDLRLLAGLDPKGHFTQQKQITIAPVGQGFVLNDITTSKFEAYDQLARVYGLFLTLNRDPKLIEFAFLLNWPKLKPEEKRTLYSKHASHELSFFLFKKDPEFFAAVIKPYLANKKDKTFVDHWLLQDDLAEYALPWKHAQLNIVEKILLSQRLKDERPLTSRHVSDLYTLLPPNIDDFIHRFDTAVKRGSLDVSDDFGLKEAAGKAMPVERLMEQQELQFGFRPADDAPTAAAGAKPMGGGMGGGMGRAGENRKLTESESLARMKMAGAENAKQLADAKDGKASDRQRRAGVSRDEAFAESKKSESDKNANGRVDVFFDESAEVAGLGIRQLYRKLDKTMEWAENNYHHLTIDQQHGGLVTVNAFWKDYASHDAAKPFLSRHLAEATDNFSEMMFALAVLDLPFEPGKHETKFDGAKMTLSPATPVVVFHEEIKAAPAADGATKVLVSQNFFRHGDRTRQENGEQIDKYVTDEFLVYTVYGCQVVITNPTSARQKLNVLVQIPQGAIPVLNSQATKTVHINLEPYHTQTVEYHFYFPAAGQFAHFPVHVAKNESLIASAAAVALNVVDKPTKIDTESWDYVSQQGSNDDVLAFLDKHNVSGLNLDRIAWRMKDAKMFDAVLKRLAARHVYQHTLWSYGLLHNVAAAAREFLLHTDVIVNECGGRLNSPLLKVDLVERRQVEHLDYKPLVNARAHSLGKRRQIVNDRFNEQYHRVLKQLGYSRQLSDDDLLVVTYYQLLQDRIEEALATFARVNVEKVATRMQYDYCAAYLDFFTDAHAKARAIAARYADHPVDRWRNTFAAITAQLNEAEGKDAKAVDADDRNQQQAQLAATEPNFDFTVEAKQINLNHQNLSAVKVNFYEMDVELLFSRNPFVQQFKGQFSSIKPNQSVAVALDGPVGAKDEGTEGTKGKSGGSGTKTIALPEALRNKNVLVEVVAAGQTKTQAYYSHSLAVQVIENYGQVKVTHQTTAKPVAKAYVKVYAQMADGQVKFYKDGYTDLRGRFDYASLNTNDLDVATKFSVLIMSDDHGALVREAAPPKR